MIPIFACRVAYDSYSHAILCTLSFFGSDVPMFRKPDRVVHRIGFSGSCDIPDEEELFIRSILTKLDAFFKVPVPEMPP